MVLSMQIVICLCANLHVLTSYLGGIFTVIAMSGIAYYIYQSMVKPSWAGVACQTAREERAEVEATFQAIRDDMVAWRDTMEAMFDPTEELAVLRIQLKKEMVILKRSGIQSLELSEEIMRQRQYWDKGGRAKMVARET
jgi:hypothetical protein